jgi:NADH-quinone oxidoreductase subunit J
MMILFVIVALVMVAGAAAVVLARNPIHSAVALVFTLIATAGLFLSLSAPFLAVIQVIVYAGAIMVLFIFVIMLLNLRAGEGGEEHLHRIGLRQSLGIALAGLLLVQLGTLAVLFPGGAPRAALSACELETGAGGLSQAVGILLYTKYLFPFEVASVLLLVAIVGAVALSRRHLALGKERDESTEEMP